MSDPETITATPTLFSWNGRLNRLPFLFQMIGWYIGITVFITALGIVLFLSEPGANNVIPTASLIALGTAFIIGILILSFPIVKRLHDLDWPGWTYLLCLIPVVGFVIFLMCFFKKGTSGPNRYGPDTLAAGGEIPIHPWKWILIPIAASFVVVIAFAGILYFLPGRFHHFANFSGKRPAGEVGDFVAKVGETEISTREFKSNLANVLKRFDPRMQQNSNMLSQVGSMLLGGMIREEIMIQEAPRRKLAVSKEEVTKFIQTFPHFVENGVFIGQKEYAKRLAVVGMTPEEFEARVRKELLVKKVVDNLTSSATVSDDEAKAFFIERNDLAKICYVLLSPRNYLLKTAPAEGELKKFFEANRTKYHLGETRQIRYIRLRLDSYAQAVFNAITEAQIQAEYSAHPNDLYPDEVRASHILIKVDKDSPESAAARARQKAEAVLAKLRSPGADFAAIAAKVSEDPSNSSQGGDLGFFRRGAMVPEFETAAFALKVGETSGIVKTQFGFHILKATDRRGYEFYHDYIKRKLAQQESQTRIESAAQAALDKLKKTGDFEGIARETGGTLSLSQPMSDVQADPALANAPGLIKDIFSLAPDGFGRPCAVSGGYIIYKLARVIPPHEPALEEVREGVIENYRYDQANRLARDTADRLLRSAGQSGDLPKAARSLQLNVFTSAPFNRNGQIDQQLGNSPDLSAAVLSNEAKALGGPVICPQGLVVFQVVQRVKPDLAQFPSQLSGLKNQLLEMKKQQIVESFLDQQSERLKKENKIQINEDRLQKILGVPAGNQ